MKTTKRILGILLSCLMLLSMLSIGVFAAGTQDDPINAATKWFGYGVDTYLLNPTIAAGVTDGTWYTLTAEQDGILFLEHKIKDVDYSITITLNGVSYEGGCIDSQPYNSPIVTAPIKTGEVATIQIVTKDAAAGTVYASMNVITGDSDSPIKVKSDGLKVVIGAGQTLYFQDDSLNAIYATKGMQVEGDVANTTFYNVLKNSESGAVNKKAFTDSDADGILEVKLGGSLGGAGAPAVKPAWAIENNSNEDQWYTLTIVDEAHECNWDDDQDADCNTCGAIREIASTTPCEHTYTDNCDATCDLCGAVRADVPHHPVGDYACNKLCCVCLADLSTAAHVYSSVLSNQCDVCNTNRDIQLPMEMTGASISQDVNGLAACYNINVTGMARDGHDAVYDNAQITVDGVNYYKLKNMGAVICNNYEQTQKLPTQEDVDNLNVIDVPAAKLYDLDSETASFAFRVIDIPESAKDTYVHFVPYLVIEDENGNEQTLYVYQWVFGATYNEVLADQ